jgi:hypothetical protein
VVALDLKKTFEPKQIIIRVVKATVAVAFREKDFRTLQKFSVPQ